jgi:DNA-binding beta-propeller fold protein YncE
LDASGQRPVLIRAVTIDSAGNIYMVSSETGKVYVYGPDEAFLFSFGTKGGTPGRLSQPRGVAVDRERGLMYVVDYMRHTILAYDKAGTYLFEFGGKGEAPGWFKFPTDVVVNKRGQLIVSDLFNHRLQVLEVKYQKEFPSLEELKRPSPPGKDASAPPEDAVKEGATPDQPSVQPDAVPEVPAVQPDAGVQEESQDQLPMSQPDVEIKEEIIPEHIPASPDNKGM